MTTDSTVDVTHLPAPLGQNVARVLPNGLPTRETLDNEEFTRQWFMSTTINMDKRLTEVRQDTDTASASVITEATARAEGDQALASQITTVSTTVGTNTASISQLQTSVNGIGVLWGINAQVGGQFGGLVFTGLSKLDGTGASFLLEIYSDVIIHGSLLVTGSVNTTEITPGAVSAVAYGASGGGSASLAIATRGGPVIITAVYAGGGATASTNVVTPPAPGFGTMTVYFDGIPQVSQPNNSDTWYTYDNFSAASSGAVSYTSTVWNRQMQTTISFVVYPAAGTHGVLVVDTSAGSLFLTATELAR